MPSDRHNFVTRLFQHQAGSLVRYLTSKVRTGSDAQDIAQETYLRLLRLNRVDLVRDPQAYLFRVAANLAREHQIKQARSPLDIRANPDALATSISDTEDRIDRQRQVEELKHVLDKLDPRHRAVLLLHRRDGMTYEEIAAELGISFHTVKKYLGVALAACREALPVPDKESP
jgi:RNA polymerase sigma-70 factor (ECF subfamily)